MPIAGLKISPPSPTRTSRHPVPPEAQMAKPSLPIRVRCLLCWQMTIYKRVVSSANQVLVGGWAGQLETEKACLPQPRFKKPPVTLWDWRGREASSSLRPGGQAILGAEISGQAKLSSELREQVCSTLNSLFSQPSMYLTPCTHLDSTPSGMLPNPTALKSFVSIERPSH